MRAIWIFIISALVVIGSAILPEKSLAQNPQIFGLHLSQTSDISKVAPIINSLGNWGWATIVIQLNQLDKQMWQDFFDQCRRLHIQPILRLATQPSATGWKKPEISQIDNFSNFINSLNWPTDNLPIILFNEINHGSEWGGEVNIREYTDIAIYATKKIKSDNPNTIILGAALDLAAPEKPPRFKSAESVYTEIASYKKEYFEVLDALASHSYPNPHFSGSVYDTGKMSIRGFEWELSFLKRLGVKADYPVYITETGWPVSKKNTRQEAFLQNQQALAIWQNYQQIRAATFFTFNYPYSPFQNFSWVDKDEKLHPEYEPILQVEKGANQPKQTTSWQYISHSLPLIVLSDTALTGRVILKNTGQSIWGEVFKCLDPIVPNDFQQIPLCIRDEDKIEPGREYIFNFTFRVPKDYKKDIYLSWQGLEPLVIKHLEPDIGVFIPELNMLQRFKRKVGTILGNL